MRVLFAILEFSVCIAAGVINSKGFLTSVFHQYVNMNNLVPDLKLFLNKNLLLFQCMFSCLYFTSCLSLFVSKHVGTGKGYQFQHRHKTGLNFVHIEGEIFKLQIGLKVKCFTCNHFKYLREKM